ncbi:MAG: hypothetical protein ABSB35_21670 [Bryobacteraceae bacterium]|jgi:hypothetical protein
MGSPATVFDGSAVEVIPPDKTFDNFVEKIKKAYTDQCQVGGKAIEAIVRVGKLCIEARAYLSKLDNQGLYQHELEKRTGLSTRTIADFGTL